MHEDFDFDGEAEMKTLQEVHDMLVLTGYKDEAYTVEKAMKIIEAYGVACDKPKNALDECMNKIKEVAQ